MYQNYSLMYFVKQGMVMLNARNLLIAAVVLVAVYMWYRRKQVEGYEPAPADVSYGGPNEMMDSANNRAWGTVNDPNARWEDLSIRPEYKKTPGDTHACKCGYASKRTVDAYGGSHHRLTHMCAPCDGKTEPVQLGQWWTRKGCGDPTSRGLNVVPYCTRCGS